MGGHAKPHRSAQKSPVKTTANTANVKLAVDAKVARCEATCPAPPETAQDDAASKTPAATAALARKLKNLVAQDIQLWQLQLQEAHKRQRVLQQRRQQLQEQELAQALQRRAHLATLMAQREAALHQQWRRALLRRQEQQRRRQKQLQAEQAHAADAPELSPTLAAAMANDGTSCARVPRARICGVVLKRKERLQIESLLRRREQ